MKKLLIIFFLPLLVISCKNSEDSTNETSETPKMERSFWANAHLKGKVKSLEETPYTLDDSGTMGEPDSCCIELTEISDKGYTAKISDKTKEGTIDSELFFKHTETGRFLSATRMRDGKEVWKRTTIYDEKGKTLHAVDTDTAQQVTYFYNDIVENEFGQSESGKMYTADSTYMGNWSFEHIDGFRTGRGWIDSTGVQLIKRTGEVNENGWISKVVDVRPDSTGNPVTLVETYTYDSFDEIGNWTQRTEKNNDIPVKVLKRTYTYYEK